jgi:GWxTD domain-containing protein
MPRSLAAAGIHTHTQTHTDANTLLAALVAAAFSTVAFAQSPPPPTISLFQKARSEVKAGKYADALTTLAALDAESRKPGMEAERAKLTSPLLFLRGVCEAELDRRAEALADFRAFLAASPNVSLDPSAYPRKSVLLFEEAKRDATKATSAAAAASAGGGTPSLAEAYERFHPDARPAGDGGEEWGKGPVQYLMTDEERRAWDKASDPASRSEVVTHFWAARDPSPDTPANEFRTEFERRVAFADATLGDGERRGSLTDRGRVFLLLGPPTWLGRGPLRAAEDASDVRPDTPGKVLDTQANYRETWHYRRDRLPSQVPFQQVDFIFVTRRGYGSNVLQRDANALATLDAARTGGRI